MGNYTIVLEADIKIEKETAYLKERASTVIDLPSAEDRQIDLMYFSAVFVSSGANLNHAYFQPSELIKAENTIVNKALDIEHEEHSIVGHIYDRVYIDKDGNTLDLKELSDLSKSDLDKQDMHIAIAGILYKDRFPEIAQDLLDNKWKVSMETYYSDFDIKIGDVIVSRQEAESVGFTDLNSIIGKRGKVIKEGKEMANGYISKVLRGIHFSGCGLVEDPANPPSIVLEVANAKSDNIIIELDNNVTSINIDYKKQEKSNLDAVGTCIYYKRRVNDKQGNIVHEDWCSEYNTTCTSFSRTVLDTECLLNSMYNEVSKYARKKRHNSIIKRELNVLDSLLK